MHKKNKIFNVLILTLLITFSISAPAFAKDTGTIVPVPGGSNNNPPGGSGEKGGGSKENPGQKEKKEKKKTTVQHNAYKKRADVVASTIKEMYENAIKNYENGSISASTYNSYITSSNRKIAIPPYWTTPKVEWSVWVEDNGKEIITHKRKIITPGVYASADGHGKKNFNKNYRFMYYTWTISGPSSMLKHRSNSNAFRGNPANYDNSAQKWQSPINPEYIFVPDRTPVGDYTLKSVLHQKYDKMEQNYINFSYYEDYGAYGSKTRLGGSTAWGSEHKIGEGERDIDPTTKTLKITTADWKHILVKTYEDVEVEVETEIIQ